MKQKAVSPKLAFPPPPIISPIKRKHLKASLVRSSSIPSTTPRRCWTRHRNAPANHASRNNGPSPAPPAINLPQTQPPFHNCTTKTQTGRRPALSQASNMRTNQKLFLHRPKQPSQRRCSIPQQTRARIDASWCRRQPARVKQKAVSPKLASPNPTNHQPHQKKTSKSITCPAQLFPQHDTPPLLDTAQE